MCMAKLKCPCGNITKWETVKTSRDKTEAVCGSCGRFVEIDGPVHINNTEITGGINFDWS